MCFYEFFKVFGYFLEIKCDDAGIIYFIIVFTISPVILRPVRDLNDKRHNFQTTHRNTAIL